ncbi:hypothetical protein MJH12_14525, partial [bacterium]|nr:hypothetical protein [bacterium]
MSTASIVEGSAGQQLVEYTITRTGDLSKTATITYALTSDNGGNSSDISGSIPSGTVTFAINETTKKVSIQVLGDILVENNENLTLTISNPTEGFITTSAVTSVVTNDDQSFEISASNATQLEGHSGTTAMTFTVTRNGSTSGNATVNYVVTGGSNLTSTDFIGSSLPSGQVSFANGESTKTLTINVSGDTTLESDENFIVTISNPSIGILGSQTTANTTITSDDDQVAVQAMTATIVEGHSGTQNVVFKITRSDTSTTQSTVKYTLTGLDIADFAAGTNLIGTAIFATGETTKDITFVLKGDVTVESDETLLLTLSEASFGTNIKTATANTIITNDDADLVIAAQAAAKVEGNSGTVPFTFTVTRSGHTVQSNTVQWRLTGTGGNPASADDFSSTDGLADNGGFPSGTVTFASGETSKTITINISGDSKYEVNEDFTVTLSSPSAGAIVKTATAVGEIQNDDALLNFASTTLTKDEVDNGATTTYTYTLNRTGNTSQQTSVNWQITGSNGFSTNTTSGDLSDITIGGSAVSGTSGTIVFTNGQTSKTVVIKVKGDNTIENDESFAFNLSSATAGTEIGTNSGVSGVVTNDDTRFDFSSNISQAEGISGTTQYVYTVTRTGRVDRTTSFNWAVSAHNPTSSGDDASSSS